MFIPGVDPATGVYGNAGIGKSTFDFGGFVSLGPAGGMEAGAAFFAGAMLGDASLLNGSTVEVGGGFGSGYSALWSGSTVGALVFIGQTYGAHVSASNTKTCSAVQWSCR
jgi:hypothetical protein